MQSTDWVNGQCETPRSAVPPGMQDEAASHVPSVDPLGPILSQLADLMKALREYAMTWSDQARIALQIGLYKAALAIVFGLAGLVMLVISSSLLLIGAATGVGVLCGGRVWVGQMIVGAAVLVITFAVLTLWRSSRSKANWKDLLRRYEHITPATQSDHVETASSPPE